MLLRNVSSGVINITFYIFIFFEIDWNSSRIRIWNSIPTRKIRKDPICLKKKCCNPLGKTNLSNLHKHISSGISVRTSAIFFLARKSVKYPIEIKTCSRSREKIIPFRSYGLSPPPFIPLPSLKSHSQDFSIGQSSDELANSISEITWKERGRGFSTVDLFRSRFLSERIRTFVADSLALDF